MIQGQVEGKRVRGQPLTAWIDSIKKKKKLLSLAWLSVESYEC